MKEKISCVIIRDLLPNCIDNVVNEKTKELIFEHIHSCDSCRKEFESMKEPIETIHADERKIDYLKGISKKCRNIIIACAIISFITLFLSIIFSSSNAYDVIFTSALIIIMFIGITLKFLIPIFGAVFCALLFKETKKKWLILICIIFSFWLGFSLFYHIHDMIITYGG